MKKNKYCFGFDGIALLQLLGLLILAGCSPILTDDSDTSIKTSALSQAFSCVVAQSGAVYWKAGLDRPPR
jgi:hypothetical protein